MEKRMRGLALALAATGAGAIAVLGHASLAVAACPNEAAREQAHAGFLVDCRAYEQVSPAQKNGNEAGVEITAAFGNVPRPEYAIARADGESLLFGSGKEVINGALGETNAGLNYFWVARRSGTGWSTKAALPPGNKEQANEKGVEVQLEVPGPLLPSADLTSFAFEMHDSFGEAAREAMKSGEEVKENGFVTHGDGSVDWISQPRVASPLKSLAEGTGGESVRISGASPDLRTVYFAYSGTLVPEDEATNPALENLSRAEVIAKEIFDVGFYEWREGTLKSAGVLPDGSLDPRGAIPASTLECNAFCAGPPDYATNQVSADGAHALFVSPSPGANPPGSDPPELYLREQLPGGSAKSVLVSKSAITGLPAKSRPLLVNEVNTENSSSNNHTYAFASPDGSRVFFDSLEPLTESAPNEEETVKQYEYDTVTETLRYLPGVAGTAAGAENQLSPIVGLSQDGSRFLFVRNTPEGKELDLWDGAVHVVTPLPAPTEREFVVSPVRANAAGTKFVFETSSPVPGGFNNGGPFEQIYRYDSKAGQLDCISCPPHGITPTGNARLSNSLTQPEVLESRGVANEAERVFFDSPDPFWVGDTNGKRDVYEWEAGAIHPITPGRSSSDSFVLDNSTDGRDVFVATLEPFTASDIDSGYDIYDAREGGGFAQTSTAAACTVECRGAGEATHVLPFPAASETLTGEGNLSPAKPKAPAAKGSQAKARLRSGLKRCAKKHGHQRKRCEQQARKRYRSATAKRGKR